MTSGAHHLTLRVVRGSVRPWHRDLVLQLRARAETTVSVDLLGAAGSGAPQAAELRGLADNALLEVVDPRHDAVPATLTIDLTPTPQRGDRTWHLAYDGRPGETTLLDALARAHLPVVTVEGDPGVVLASGRPGTETPRRIDAAYEDVMAGCRTLLIGALDGNRFALPGRFPEASPGPALGGAHALNRLVEPFTRRLYPALFRPSHWRVGWRWVTGPGAVDRLDHPEGGWQELGDDGSHFYADPFPLVHDGRTFLFVEDFDHRIGKGVISVVEFDGDGPVGAPRPVLTHDVHLSYPHVFEHAGLVWMIPETSAARTVELYRATSFPDRWALESVLLKDVEASDATIFPHEGRWWMTAAVRLGGAFSDCLHLWTAPDPTGPWSPHRGNPVLVDIAGARPAGQVVERGGRLIRPVQDGRAGYGTALAVYEITRLDDQSFDQRLLGTLGPGERWPGRRLHTLNRAGPLECIDGSAISPRWLLPRLSR